MDERAMRELQSPVGCEQAAWRAMTPAYMAEVLPPAILHGAGRDIDPGGGIQGHLHCSKGWGVPRDSALPACILPAMSGSGTYETYGLGAIGSASEVKPDIGPPFTEVQV